MGKKKPARLVGIRTLKNFSSQLKKKEEQFEFVVKMAVIIKELMNGCDNLDPEFSEEAIGHNALAAGFQGQRQWTDFYPNGDFAEAMLNTSFDWNGAREPYILLQRTTFSTDLECCS